MPEARNVTAIKDWCHDQRPDLVPHITRIADGNVAQSDAFILLMTTAFEAGRMFQSKLADPARYVAMEETY
jgi:hypothetical protein